MKTEFFFSGTSCGLGVSIMWHNTWAISFEFGPVIITFGGRGNRGKQ